MKITGSVKPTHRKKKSGLKDRPPFLKTIVNSPTETRELAGHFAANLTAGDVVAFYGNLGTGKTFFIKALCQALGCVQQATSPSFTIINQYHTGGDLFIYHFDFYRLISTAELQNLGLEEFFYDEQICLLEWAEKVSPFLPAHRWEIYLDFITGKAESRQVTIVKKEASENDSR